MGATSVSMLRGSRANKTSKLHPQTRANTFIFTYANFRCTLCSLGRGKCAKRDFPSLSSSPFHIYVLQKLAKFQRRRFFIFFSRSLAGAGTLPLLLLFVKCLSGKVGGKSIMRFLDFQSKNFFSHSFIFAKSMSNSKVYFKGIVRRRFE